MKTTKEKTFDAVKMQRKIRDKISSETENMTSEELVNYVRERIKQTRTKPIGQK